MRRRLAEYLWRVQQKEMPGAAERVLLTALDLYRRARGAAERSDNRFLSQTYLRWKHAERAAVSWRYTFVTFAELVAWTDQWARTFPTSYDLIVGIPRSGLLVASQLALKLGKPLATPELLVEGQCWRSGEMELAAPPGRLLLADDSVSSGATFAESLRRVKEARGEWEVTTGAVIVTPETKGLVDLHHVVIPKPRLFEWNMLHVKPGRLATDLDGVLCENCPPGVDEDEDAYAAWIRTARPYLVPAFEVDFIVSSRLARYRDATEEWLARHGVRYRELLMWGIESKRLARGGHARQKIEKLVRIKPDMFWESSVVQAEEIWKATKIPTLCVDEMRLFA